MGTGRQVGHPGLNIGTELVNTGTLHAVNYAPHRQEIAHFVHALVSIFVYARVCIPTQIVAQILCDSFAKAFAVSRASFGFS